MNKNALKVFLPVAMCCSFAYATDITFGQSNTTQPVEIQNPSGEYIIKGDFNPGWVSVDTPAIRFMQSNNTITKIQNLANLDTNKNYSIVFLGNTINDFINGGSTGLDKSAYMHGIAFRKDKNSPTTTTITNFTNNGTINYITGYATTSSSDKTLANATIKNFTNNGTITNSVNIHKVDKLVNDGLITAFNMYGTDEINVTNNGTLGDFRARNIGEFINGANSKIISVNGSTGSFEADRIAKFINEGYIDGKHMSTRTDIGTQGKIQITDFTNRLSGKISGEMLADIKGVFSNEGSGEIVDLTLRLKTTIKEFVNKENAKITGLKITKDSSIENFTNSSTQDIKGINNQGLIKNLLHTGDGSFTISNENLLEKIENKGGNFTLQNNGKIQSISNNAKGNFAIDNSGNIAKIENLGLGNITLENKQNATFIKNGVYHIKHTGAGKTLINNWDFIKSGKIIIDNGSKASNISLQGRLIGNQDIFKEHSFVQYLITRENEASLDIMKNPQNIKVAGNEVNNGDFIKDFLQNKVHLSIGAGSIVQPIVREDGMIVYNLNEAAIAGPSLNSTSINSFNVRLTTAQNTLREISTKNFKSQNVSLSDTIHKEALQEKIIKAKAYKQAQKQKDSYIAQGYEDSYTLYATLDSNQLLYDEALRGYSDIDVLNALDDIFIKQNRDFSDIYTFVVPHFNLTKDASSIGKTTSRSQGLLIGAQANSKIGIYGIYGVYESTKRENSAVSGDMEDKVFLGGLTYYNAFSRFGNKEAFVNISTSLGHAKSNLTLIDADGYKSDSSFGTLNYGGEIRAGLNAYDVLTNSIITPEIGVVYTGLKTDAFDIYHKSVTEHYKSVKTDIFEGIAGVRYYKANSQDSKIIFAGGTKFKIYDNAKTKMYLKGTDILREFDVALPDIYFYIQAGYTKLIGENTELSFNYQANFTHNIQSHTGFIRLGYWW